MEPVATVRPAGVPPSCAQVAAIPESHVLRPEVMPDDKTSKLSKEGLQNFKNNLAKIPVKGLQIGAPRKKPITGNVVAKMYTRKADLDSAKKHLDTHKSELPYTNQAANTRVAILIIRHVPLEVSKEQVLDCLLQQNCVPADGLRIVTKLVSKKSLKHSKRTALLLLLARRRLEMRYR